MATVTSRAARGERRPVPRRPRVRRTEIDGVPTFWHPAPGPLRAALIFRVGRADEQLAQAGISHLVEHLTLASLGERDHPVNGFVDHHRTVFYSSGSAEEVGTGGVEFHPELDTDRVEAVFEKGRYAAAYSGFEGHAGTIGLAAWLRMRVDRPVTLSGWPYSSVPRCRSARCTRRMAWTILPSLPMRLRTPQAAALSLPYSMSNCPLPGKPAVNARDQPSWRQLP